MNESDVRKYFLKLAAKNGCRVDKFTSPSNRDVPDELLTTPWGEMHLVELKRPGGKLRPGQVRDHAARRQLGVYVRVLADTVQIDQFFRCISL